MIVTLKKAAALSLALSAIKIDVPLKIEVGAYDSLPNLFDADTQLVRNVEAVLNRNAAVYEIRHLIGVANEGRINELIGIRAMIDKQLAFLNSIPTVTKRPNSDVIERELGALREAPADNYGRKKSLTVEVHTASHLEPHVRRLKRLRIGIEDELAQLNYTNTIELPDDVVALLQEHDLV